MKENKFWYIFHRIISVARIALLVLLIVFFALPLFKQPIAAISNAGLQRTRCQVIAKDALILEYDNDSQNTTQAYGQLQTVLPVWEQEQQALYTYPDSQVATLLIQMNSDFTLMDAAAKQILQAKGKPADPIQVKIILQHEHSYLVASNQVTLLIQDDIASQIQQLALIEVVLFVLLVVGSVVNKSEKRKNM